MLIDSIFIRQCLSSYFSIAISKHMWSSVVMCSCSQFLPSDKQSQSRPDASVVHSDVLSHTPPYGETFMGHFLVLFPSSVSLTSSRLSASTLKLCSPELS